MKKAIEKKLKGGKEKFGMNFTINHDLDKESQVVLFPKKLEAANKLLSRMHH
jgi:hypothetical protein